MHLRQLDMCLGHVLSATCRSWATNHLQLVRMHLQPIAINVLPRVRMSAALPPAIWEFNHLIQSRSPQTGQRLQQSGFDGFTFGTLGAAARTCIADGIARSRAQSQRAFCFHSRKSAPQTHVRTPRTLSAACILPSAPITCRSLSSSNDPALKDCYVPPCPPQLRWRRRSRSRAQCTCSTTLLPAPHTPQECLTARDRDVRPCVRRWRSNFRGSRLCTTCGCSIKKPGWTWAAHRRERARSRRPFCSGYHASRRVLSPHKRSPWADFVLVLWAPDNANRAVETHARAAVSARAGVYAAVALCVSRGTPPRGRLKARESYFD
jgi:hypothetical protein